jgi:hypothetical protein
MASPRRLDDYINLPLPPVYHSPFDLPQFLSFVALAFLFVIADRTLLSLQNWHATDTLRHGGRFNVTTLSPMPTIVG